MNKQLYDEIHNEVTDWIYENNDEIVSRYWAKDFAYYFMRWWDQLVMSGQISYPLTTFCKVSDKDKKLLFQRWKHDPNGLIFQEFQESKNL